MKFCGFLVHKNALYIQMGVCLCGVFLSHNLLPVALVFFLNNVKLLTHPIGINENTVSVKRKYSSGNRYAVAYRKKLKNKITKTK